jgi:cytochrome c5
MWSTEQAEDKRVRDKRMRLTSRYFPLAFILLSSPFALSGCRQDMHNQPKYRPLRASDFFADGQAARPLVAGTVARGDLRDDFQLYTGRVRRGGTASLVPGSAASAASIAVPGAPAGQLSPFRSYVTDFPYPITHPVLDRGQDRYNAFCTPCHDRVGTGQGMVVRRGYRRPPSFHIDRLRQAPVGYLFDVITNGFGAMPDYASQIPPQDRWAIIAYLRALQLSQQASLTDVPPQERDRLKSGGPAR